MNKFLKEFKDRGYFYQCTSEADLSNLLDKEKIKAYIGFDCTAESLHVGSLLQIMCLRLLQKNGHQPIVLLGGGTTRIGDPSGKDTTRKLLKDNEIKNNIQSIKKVFNSESQVFVLENHGLIVAGNDLQQTYDLLLSVHQKLDIIRNNNSEINNYNSESVIENYSLKNEEKYNLFKTSNKKLFSAFSKSFYPDHVIFLGPGVPTFENLNDVNNFLNNIKSKNINPPPYLILKGIGLYEISSVTSAAREMIDCFLEVLLRINFEDELKYLSQPQENELLNWDAEIYRQSIH